MAPRPAALTSRDHHLSFSTVLLDAIYHSLKADVEARLSMEVRRTPPSSPTQRTPLSSLPAFEDIELKDLSHDHRQRWHKVIDEHGEHGHSATR